MTTQKTKKADILIADHQIESLKLLSEIIEKEGYSVRQAIDGEMALIAVNSQTPDLILLGVELEKVDSYQVCKKLKQEKKTADIPVIFLSDFDNFQKKIESLKIGAIDYLIKPYQPEELLVKIENQVKISLKIKELQKINENLEKQLKLRKNISKMA